MNAREQEILTTIGRNLRAARKAHGLTQEDAARKAGLHTTQVARMERGEVQPGIVRFVRLAWALDTTPARLLDGLDTP